MLLKGFSDIPLGVFYGSAIAVTARQGRAIGHIAIILGLFLDDNLKRIIFHIPSSLWPEYSTTPIPTGLSTRFRTRRPPGDGKAHSAGTGTPGAAAAEVSAECNFLSAERAFQLNTIPTACDNHQ